MAVVPASAQLAGTASVDSDYRIRGYSISGNKPAASAFLSYDDPSGLYASGTAISALSYDNHPDLLGVIADVGYAKRITPQISLDGGIARTQYFHDAATLTGNAHYTEFYAGFIVHGISAHAYLSPDYHARHISTVYGEVDVLLKSFGPWYVSGHVGVLGYISTPRYIQPNTQYDWQVGLSRNFGHFDLHVNITGGGPDDDFYRSKTHRKTAVGGGASWSF